MLYSSKALDSRRSTLCLSGTYEQTAILNKRKNDITLFSHLPASLAAQQRLEAVKKQDIKENV
ncbi:MAG: hypothetical protein V2B20_07975 [Pseudomonadota bacterium]